MPDLKMKTQVVSNTANDIRNINIKIRDDFDNLCKKVNNLNNSWDGSASDAALKKFTELKNDYSKPRYTVIDNYVAFLCQQIGEGYTQTEDANEKIADQLAAQFK